MFYNFLDFIVEMFEPLMVYGSVSAFFPRNRLEVSPLDIGERILFIPLNETKN